MLKVGAKIITLRSILGIPSETEMTIKRVLHKEELFDVEDVKGNVFRMYMSTKGASWELVNEFEWLEKLDSSDKSFLLSEELRQVLFAASINDDEEWMKELHEQIFENENNELEEL